MKTLADLQRDGWESGINQVIQADCLLAMKLIPDKSIDAIICDLPYGTTACSWDTVIPFDKLWEQYKRIVTDNAVIVLFASQPFTTDLINSNRSEFKYLWTWDKGICTGFLHAKRRPMKQTEDILVFCKTNNSTYNPQMEKLEPGDYRIRKKRTRKSKIEVYGGLGSVSSADWNSVRYPKNLLKHSSNMKGNNRFHPTQKPLPLLKYLLNTYSLPGDLILDNCMGSWTTARACKDLKRNFIGFELEEKYCKVGEERLRQENLF